MTVRVIIFSGTLNYFSSSYSASAGGFYPPYLSAINTGTLSLSASDITATFIPFSTTGSYLTGGYVPYISASDIVATFIPFTASYYRSYTIPTGSGGGGGVTVQYKLRGFYTGSGQYEQWLSINPDSSPTSGHTLLDITHTVINRLK